MFSDRMTGVLAVSTVIVGEPLLASTMKSSAAVRAVAVPATPPEDEARCVTLDVSSVPLPPTQYLFAIRLRGRRSDRPDVPTLQATLEGMRVAHLSHERDALHYLLTGHLDPGAAVRLGTVKKR